MLLILVLLFFHGECGYLSEHRGQLAGERCYFFGANPDYRWGLALDRDARTAVLKDVAAGRATMFLDGRAAADHYQEAHFSKSFVLVDGLVPAPPEHVLIGSRQTLLVGSEAHFYAAYGDYEVAPLHSTLIYAPDANKSMPSVHNCYHEWSGSSVCPKRVHSSPILVLQVAFLMGCQALALVDVEPIAEQWGAPSLRRLAYFRARWEASSRSVWTTVSRHDLVFPFRALSDVRADPPPPTSDSWHWHVRRYLWESPINSSSTAVKTVLLLNYFRPHLKERAAELDTVLRFNMMAELTELVLVITERCDAAGPEYTALRQAVDSLARVARSSITVQRVSVACSAIRPTFQQFFKIAFAHADAGSAQSSSSSSDTVYIVQNSDIFVCNGTDKVLADDARSTTLFGAPGDRVALATARYNLPRAVSSGKLGHGIHIAHGASTFKQRGSDASQDAWLLRTPLDRQLTEIGDFRMGLWAVDNRIAAELQSIGYKVRNLARSLFFCHLHSDLAAHSFRSDRFILPPPHAFVPLE